MTLQKDGHHMTSNDIVTKSSGLSPHGNEAQKLVLKIMRLNPFPFAFPGITPLVTVRLITENFCSI